MNKFYKVALVGMLLLTACTKQGADTDDPIESSSIPINGEGTDPLYTRLASVLGDLPALATLLKSGLVDDVLCHPRTCEGSTQSGCSLMLQLSDGKRDLCIQSLKSNADGIAAFGARSVTSLFREATKPLVRLGGDGQRRRMTMMTRNGPDGHVAIDRALAMALSFYEFVAAVLHELIGHKLLNPAVAKYTGDLSAAGPFAGLEPGRDYADTVAAAAAEVIKDNLSAVPGSLDHTFNDSGTVTTAPAGLSGEVRGLWCNDDGTTLATGTAGNSVAVARYRRDGTLDPAFGVNGFSTFALSTTQAKSVTRDGEKTLVAGCYVTNGGHPFVARLTPTGQLDTTFGSGFLTAPFDAFSIGGYYGMAMQVYPLANGTHLVTGARYTPTVSAGFVMRLNAAHQLDPTYGYLKPNTTERYGYVVSTIQTQLNAGGLDYASAVGADGSMLLLTYGKPSGNAAAAPMLWLSRFTPNGLPDTTFGNGTGVFGIEYEPDDVTGYVVNPRVLLQPDGAILVSGYSARSASASEVPRLLIARVRADGSDYDSSFGTSGRLVLPLSTSGNLSYGDLALQPDGRLLIAARALRANGDFVVTRLNANGTDDASFNGGEPAYKDFGTRQDRARALCLQPGGKIVVGGSTTGSGNMLWALARFNNH